MVQAGPVADDAHQGVGAIFLHGQWPAAIPLHAKVTSQTVSSYTFSPYRRRMRQLQRTGRSRPGPRCCCPTWGSGCCLCPPGHGPWSCWSSWARIGTHGGLLENVGSEALFGLSPPCGGRERVWRTETHRRPARSAPRLDDHGWGDTPAGRWSGPHGPLDSKVYSPSQGLLAPT